MTRFTRFLRKPPREKAAAVLATVRSAAHTYQDWGRVYPWVVVNHIDFRSGLGNSSYLLHGLVRSMKPNLCVEIGSARGRSACFIGLALKDNGRGKLIAIDPHKSTAWNDSNFVETIDIIRDNIRYLGIEQQVEIRRQTSAEAAQDWTDRIDLIFIDGDHSYEGVKRDWDSVLAASGQVRDCGLPRYDVGPTTLPEPNSRRHGRTSLPGRTAGGGLSGHYDRSRLRGQPGASHAGWTQAKGLRAFLGAPADSRPRGSAAA